VKSKPLKSLSTSSRVKFELLEPLSACKSISARKFCRKLQSTVVVVVVVLTGRRVVVVLTNTKSGNTSFWKKATSIPIGEGMEEMMQ